MYYLLKLVAVAEWVRPLPPMLTMLGLQDYNIPHSRLASELDNYNDDDYNDNDDCDDGGGDFLL